MRKTVSKTERHLVIRLIGVGIDLDGDQNGDEVDLDYCKGY